MTSPASKPVKPYPHIRTERHTVCHPKIVVRFAADEPEHELCGFSWCEGDCGLPAGVLVMPDGSERKMFSDMTAMGPLMQRFRNEWRGPKLVIREEFRADLMERWWS